MPGHSQCGGTANGGWRGVEESNKNKLVCTRPGRINSGLTPSPQIIQQRGEEKAERGSPRAPPGTLGKEAEAAKGLGKDGQDEKGPPRLFLTFLWARVLHDHVLGEVGELVGEGSQAAPHLAQGLAQARAQAAEPGRHRGGSGSDGSPPGVPPLLWPSPGALGKS